MQSVGQELTFKFLLIGKSARARKFVASTFTADDSVPSIYDFSVHKRELIISDRPTVVQLWNADVDTLEFFDKEEFIKGAHAVVFVYDGTSYESFEAVAKYMQVPGYVRQVGMILRMLEEGEEEEVPVEEAKSLAQKHDYLCTSITSTGTKKLEKLLAKLSRALKEEHELSLAHKRPKADDLHRLVRNQDVDRLKLCLYGERPAFKENLLVDVNVLDKLDRTLLHVAASEGSIDVCAMLIDAGAQLNARDRDQRTPLHAAACRDIPDIVELLLRRGANGTLREKRHLTYAGVAAMEGNLEVLLLAINRGADVSEVRDIDLSGKQLSQFPPDFPWAKLVGVRSLDLEGNNLDMLPSAIADLPLLERVSLEGNPLRFVPQEFRSSWLVLRDYIRSIGDKARNWKGRKLLFVGQDGVGKTTLLKALQSKKLKVSCRENLSTDGINVHDDVNVADTNLQFNAWDLGGQQVYYPSHQFFLASNSVFMVVFNLVAPDFTFLDDWMRQIYTINNSISAPVIIVGTHLDSKQLTPEKVQEVLDSVRQRYPRHRFRGMVDVLAVSNKTGKGMLALVEAMKGVFSTVSFPDLPERWVHFYEYLKNAKQERGSEWVQFSQLAAWARKCGITNAELPLCTKFLGDVGLILHFDDANSKLNEIVILNPQFLADIMANILSFTHNWLKGGLLTPQMVPQVFYRHDPSMTERIIALLIRFHIVYKVKDSDNYLVPLLLPADFPKPEFLQHWPSLPPPGIVEYGREYHFRFVPHGFFSRILVRLFHQPDLERLMVWRLGAILRMDDQLALVTYDTAKSAFNIIARVPRSSNASGQLLRAVIEVLEALICCYYPRLKESTKRLLPCTHCINANTRTPFMFSYAECIQAVTHGKPFVFCHHIMSPSRCVRIDQLAPDIAFTDLPRISNDKITLGEKLGAGGFGTVYKGMYNGMEVALKELKFIIGDDNERVEKFNEFQQEAWIMSCLDHPHLVKLLGVTVYPLRMVMELVHGGDLFEFMHPKCPETAKRLDRPQESFPWPLRFKIALDIAVGMRYLQHGINPPIIHRDLRSPNIFIVSSDPANDVCAKVADFGLARLVAPDIAGSLGTWQWLAPEVLDKANQQYDERSDVYSFGIVLWELCTLQIPFIEYLDNEELTMTCWDGRGVEMKQFDAVSMKMEIIHKNLRPTIPMDLDVRLRVLIERCLSANPVNRPSFLEVVRTLTCISGMKVADDLDQAQATRATMGEVQRAKNNRNSFLILPEDCALSDKLQQESITSVTRIVNKLAVQQKVRCLLRVADSMWVGLQDGSMQVYNADHSFRASVQAPAHSSTLHAMVVVGASVWVGCEDGSITVWNGVTMEMEKRWEAHPNNIIKALLCVQVDGEPARVWSASPSEKAIRVWDSETYEQVTVIQQQHSVNCMEQHHATVWTGGSDKLFIFHAASAELRGHWRAHDSSVTSIVSVGNRVWTGSAGGEIKIWEDRGSELSLVGTQSVHNAKVLALCSMNNLMWSGSLDKSIILWDGEGDTAPVQEITDHKDAVWAIEDLDGNVWTAADRTLIIYAHQARSRSTTTTEVVLRQGRKGKGRQSTNSLQLARGVGAAVGRGLQRSNSSKPSSGWTASKLSPATASKSSSSLSASGPIESVRERTATCASPGQTLFKSASKERVMEASPGRRRFLSTARARFKRTGSD